MKTGAWIYLCVLFSSTCVWAELPDRPEIKGISSSGLIEWDNPGTNGMARIESTASLTPAESVNWQVLATVPVSSRSSQWTVSLNDRFLFFRIVYEEGSPVVVNSAAKGTNSLVEPRADSFEGGDQANPVTNTVGSIVSHGNILPTNAVSSRIVYKDPYSGKITPLDEEITMTMVNVTDRPLFFRMTPRDPATAHTGLSVRDSISYTLAPTSDITFSFISGPSLLAVSTEDERLPRIVPAQMYLRDIPVSRRYTFDTKVNGKDTGRWNLVGKETRTKVSRSTLNVPESLRIFVTTEDKVNRDPKRDVTTPLRLGSIKSDKANLFEQLRSNRRRTLVEPYLARADKNAVWFTQVREILEAFSNIVPGRSDKSFEKDSYGITGTDFTESGLRNIVLQCEDAMTNGCKDPALLYVAGSCYSLASICDSLDGEIYMRDGHQATERYAVGILRRAVDGLEASGYPAVVKCRALTQLLDAKDFTIHFALQKEYEDRLLKEAALMQVDGSFSPQEDRVAFREFSQALDTLYLVGVGNYAETFSRESYKSLSPWLKYMLTGYGHELTMNFHRDNNSMDDHDRAIECYQNALAVDPTRPEAPSKLLKFAFASGGDLAGRTLREWFDVVVGADPDYLDAYAQMMRGLIPGQDDNWESGNFVTGFPSDRVGSPDDLFEFGLRCAETKRYDTVAPLFCYEAFACANHFSKNFDVYGRSNAFETVVTALQEAALDPAHLHERDWILSIEAGLSVALKRQDRAKAVMDILGGNLQSRALTRFQLTVKDVRDFVGASVADDAIVANKLAVLIPPTGQSGTVTLSLRSGASMSASQLKVVCPDGLGVEKQSVEGKVVVSLAASESLFSHLNIEGNPDVEIGYPDCPTIRIHIYRDEVRPSL